MIKIYEYQNKNLGMAFKRISKALHDYSPPDIKWTDYAGSASIILVHVVGGGEVPIMENVLESGRKLLIIQHVVKTGGVYPWNEYFKQAILSVSFHDLASYYPKDRFNSYSTPWGYDPKEFSRIEMPKKRKVLGTGYVADTECLDKLYQACLNTDNIMYHTGKDFEFGKNYYHLPWLNDVGFNEMLNSVQYTSCLRDIEGFEMMGVEGLVCGAVPIVPALDTYRWYRKHGIFVDMHSDITKQLEDILVLTPTPPDEDELEEIHQKFSWECIVPKIFAHLG